MFVLGFTILQIRVHINQLVDIKTGYLSTVDGLFEFDIVKLRRSPVKTDRKRHHTLIHVNHFTAEMQAGDTVTLEHLFDGEANFIELTYRIEQEVEKKVTTFQFGCTSPLFNSCGPQYITSLIDTVYAMCFGEQDNSRKQSQDNSMKSLCFQFMKATERRSC